MKKLFYHKKPFSVNQSVISVGIINTSVHEIVHISLKLSLTFSTSTEFARGCCKSSYPLPITKQGSCPQEGSGGATPNKNHFCGAKVTDSEFRARCGCLSCRLLIKLFSEKFMRGCQEGVRTNPLLRQQKD